MTNDVLISIPLFVFMGYIIERANILDRLFRSLQLAAGPMPGALAIATLATCAIFATATGIVGAVVTLMGLLAFPAMLRAGYDVKIVGRRGLRRRLPRHPHSAERDADPLRRDRRRLGGEALCRRVLPRHHAGRALHALTMIMALLNPKLAPQLPPEERNVPFGKVVWALVTSFLPLAALISRRSARSSSASPRRRKPPPWARSARCCSPSPTARTIPRRWNVHAGQALRHAGGGVLRLPDRVPASPPSTSIAAWSPSRCSLTLVVGIVLLPGNLVLARSAEGIRCS